MRIVTHSHKISSFLHISWPMSLVVKCSFSYDTVFFLFPNPSWSDFKVRLFTGRTLVINVSTTAAYWHDQENQPAARAINLVFGIPSIAFSSYCQSQSTTSIIMGVEILGSWQETANIRLMIGSLTSALLLRVSLTPVTRTGDNPTLLT